ncbi:MAG: putative transposase [Patiriisocius sp.]|jgi:putative transposase
MERSISFQKGDFYHVYNRGVNKDTIFFRDSDNQQFQRLLYVKNSSKRIDTSRVKGVPLHKIERGETLVDILAYCLMPNHFHIMLHEKEEGGISKFMGKLSTAYSMYINTKYKRTGPLVCRPFRSKYVDNDDYFKWVMSYIHANPIKLFTESNSTQTLLTYPYSSYVDYKEQLREESLILNIDALPIELGEIENLT